MLLALACKKEENSSNLYVEDKIILKDLLISGDSVTLNWEKQGKEVFNNYRIYRIDSLDIESFSVNSNSTFFIDTSVPKSSFIGYHVSGSLKNGKFINSNTQLYIRPEIKSLYINPFEAKYDHENDLVYFFEESGKITIFDYEKEEIINSINLNERIGYCDFGYFNGKKELYVPGKNGALIILDALTLIKITQISVGIEMLSVVSNKNTLFISTASNNPNKSFLTYNRTNKLLISEISNNLKTKHIKLIPNSNSEILEISSGLSPNNSFNKYFFDSLGKHIKTINILDNNSLNSNLLEIIPLKQKFILSKKGAIFDYDLNLVAFLPYGNLEFTCFEFDNTQNKIYAGSNKNTIEVFDLSNYFHLETIKVENNPWKIIRNSNNNLIVLSLKTSIFSGYPPRIMIEKIIL